MRNMKDFGHYIAQRRKHMGMTQEQLAGKLGITPQAVSKWENGIGYPDVSLLVPLALLLGVSIDSLFTQANTIALPTRYRSLSLILHDDETACYSDKSVETHDTHTVRFTDGSEADLQTKRVCNRGKGDVVLLPCHRPHDEDDDRPHTMTEPLDSFEHITLSLAIPCDVTVISCDDDPPSLTAVGSPCFIGSLHTHCRNGTLKISLHSQIEESLSDLQDRITVRVPASCKRLTIKAAGGNLRLLSPFTDTDILLCDNSRLLLLTNGTHLALCTEGNADITVAGNTHSLSCVFHAPTILHAEGLSATTAHIQSDTAVTLHIGRIRKESVECLHPDTTLIVRTRG